MKRNHKGLLLAAALFFAAMAAVSGYQLYKISKEYKAGDEDLRQMYAAMESAGERAKEKTPEMSVGDGQDESREEQRPGKTKRRLMSGRKKRKPGFCSTGSLKRPTAT